MNLDPRYVGLSFSEIEVTYGEEEAIEAGFLRDPDAVEITAELMAKARPLKDAHPDIYELFTRNHSRNGKTPPQPTADNADARPQPAIPAIP